MLCSFKRLFGWVSELFIRLYCIKYCGFGIFQYISLILPINAHSGQNQPDNFEGEMLTKTLPTTLLQIFCKIIPKSKVIVKSITDPDDNFWMKP